MAEEQSFKRNVAYKMRVGEILSGKIILDGAVLGFEIKTKEFSNPLFVSPGHNISVETALDLISKSIVHPHKLPEPLHLAHKLGRKVTRNKE